MTASHDDWSSLYDFWFPPGLDDADAHRRMISWWFDGGSNAAMRPFLPVMRAAAVGRLNAWRASPRGRLSLILALDQLPRGLHAGTAQAYASDPDALRVAEEGLATGDLGRLTHPWEKMFFVMPLVHAEGPDHAQRLRRVVGLVDALVGEASDAVRWFYQFSTGQARGHLAVIERFGRFPHRNPILGRVSTPDELAYLERGDFVHRRRPQPG